MVTVTVCVLIFQVLESCLKITLLQTTSMCMYLRVTSMLSIPHEDLSIPQPVKCHYNHHCFSVGPPETGPEVALLVTWVRVWREVYYTWEWAGGLAPVRS